MKMGKGKVKRQRNPRRGNSLLSFPMEHLQKEEKKKVTKNLFRSENSKELRRHILGSKVSRQETLIPV